jgi:hypothetical protein
MKREIATALSDDTGVLRTFFKNHQPNTLYIDAENSLYNLIKSSKEGKAYYEEVYGQALELHNQKNQAAAQVAHESVQQQQAISPKAYGAVYGRTAPQHEDYYGFGPKKRIPTPSIPDAYANAVTITSHGGSKRRPKSSRRHRRGRTFHKRRKSSKVRKTRYRRTHSRTRR